MGKDSRNEWWIKRYRSEADDKMKSSILDLLETNKNRNVRFVDKKYKNRSIEIVPGFSNDNHSTI